MILRSECRILGFEIKGEKSGRLLCTAKMSANDPKRTLLPSETPSTLETFLGHLTCQRIA
jgi:hypothetical protein